MIYLTIKINECVTDQLVVNKIVLPSCSLHFSVSTPSNIEYLKGLWKLNSEG